ncbi:MotA/TolQ/ExbB proton channel family protein [Algisphaera agarilytica]|uniref:Biopolymer transport protein ExbB n=1 Tax=Algisphaera agarilytica TaxID=1385975 RepID=A0A7X0LJ47_9BACT|nr:MotA/TolQ/ExbB proton channel family protein [Algisphaera agarilytica]MBB6428414.1 biopolymer transport protein ExbB [Algisphaera agarilytica]
MFEVQTIAIWAGAADLIDRGGVVMWPILALSVLAVALLLERGAFFLRTNAPGRLDRVQTMGKRLRAGDQDGAKQLADTDASVYGDTVRRLLDEKVTEAAATDALEAQRRRLERFLPILSTIITAAPMLGILGTVLGIIDSFEVLGEQSTTRDPSLVGRGIAEALITTAAGLVVALITLLPYNLIRAQVDRTLSRLESLVASALTKESV